MRYVSDKIVGKITFLVQRVFFPRKFCRLWNNAENCGRVHLKCDGTRAEIRFRLSAKRTSPFKSAGWSVQSTTGSRGVRISGSNAGYTMFWGSVKSTGYPLHWPVSPSLPLWCVTVTSPNPQAGGPPLFGCPRLLIQCIRSYPPYRRPFLYPQPEEAPCCGDRDPLHGTRCTYISNLFLE